MNSTHAGQKKDLIALGGNIATDVGRVKTRYVRSYQRNNNTLEDIFLPPTI